VPFVSGPPGSRWPIAARVMTAQAQAAGRGGRARAQHYSVKEAVFLFAKFPEADPIWGRR
jgi:hypothetical protein